ncbi:hypothetical protein UFOVP247_108 [uncultured Caudovirales phage]|uniref:Uncharacterized protein n=1 Tax=uncultured Caudovirales phage TaxID=2100421 RepID=A0A6J7WWJ4_9CAUD|nr:hypothetical protein UFOVP247_108 [uncultured Caudovirales phage]
MATLIKVDTSTTPDSLKEMTGTDNQYVIHQMLTQFAASSTGVGTISVNPASTVGLTAIGTFTDTYRPYNVGDHPIGTTINSVTYTFYQDLGTATESLVRPLEYVTATGLKEQVDASLNADVISAALANLVSSGLGGYELNSSTPIGGTWVSQATVTNNIDATNSNVTYLWRKSAAAATPTTVRSVKSDTSTTPSSVKEMTDAEMKTLTDRMRNQIVSTGIGQYRVQASAPVSGGTWVTSGVSFSDTTRTASTVSYTGYYTGNYTGGSYTGTYSGTYTGSYSGTYTGSYTGTYTGNYTGTYRKSFAGFLGVAYSGTYTGFYTGTYTGSYTGKYSGDYTGSYSGSYTGGSYSGAYTGVYSGLTLDATTSTVSTVYLWVRTA